MGGCVPKCSCNIGINLDKELRHVLCPRRESESLKEAWETLQRAKLGVEQQNSELKGRPGLVVRDDVNAWLEKVNQLGIEVSELLPDKENVSKLPSTRPLLRRLFCIACHNYSLGEKISKKLEAVRGLISEQKAWSNMLATEVKALADAKQELQEKVHDLEALRDHTERFVENQLLSDPGKMRSKGYMNWLNRVTNVGENSKKVVAEGNAIDMARLGERVKQLSVDVEKLRDKDRLVTIDDRKMLREDRRELVKLKKRMEEKVKEKLREDPLNMRSESAIHWLQEAETAIMMVEEVLIKPIPEAEITSGDEQIEGRRADDDATIARLRVTITKLLKDGKEFMSDPSILVIKDAKKELQECARRLVNIRADTERSVQELLMSEPGKVRSGEYQNWLKSVTEIEEEVKKVVAEGSEDDMARLGKQAKQLGVDLEKLKGNSSSYHLLLIVDDREMLREDRKELVKLKGRLEEVVKEKLQEDPLKMRSDRVVLWFQQVETVLKQVEAEVFKAESGTEITNAAEEVQGRRAKGLRATIRTLREDGNELMSTTGILVVPQRIYNLPGPLADYHIDIEHNISKVFGYLKDDGVYRIGIYGMGGVGKTTLVKEIVARLKQPNPPVQFDHVISLLVSQNPSLPKIQEDIASQLGYNKDLPQEETQRACILSGLLSKKTFLLILDDVWKKIELEEIGVPSLQDRKPKSKIVLTTREKDVCTDMRCGQVMEIHKLSFDDSWELFCHHIPAASELFESSKEIHLIAKYVVQRCGGLPLVILTVALVLAKLENVGEWRDAKSRLDPAGYTISKMEDVYKLLKFSFDYLESDEHRSCLLLCALFPEDEIIEIRALVNVMIGEGLLEGRGLSDFEELHDVGKSIVGKLQRAFLLESVDGDYFVKMHDVVRDMAIWVSKGGGCNYDGCKFYTEISEVPRVMVVKKWSEVHRVFLYHQENGDVELVMTEEVMCHSSSNSIPLRTFIFRTYFNCCINVPEGFFHLAKNLRVLDISRIDVEDNPMVLSQQSVYGQTKGSQFFNKICEKRDDQSKSLFNLPKSMFQLKSLRRLNLSRLELQYIPKEISCLLSLQFLNLSNNDIGEIPVELGKLTNLVVLILNSNNKITSIPRAAISPLMKLQIMDFSNTPCFKRKEEGGLRIEDLRNMRGLKDVCLHLENNTEDVNKLLYNDALQAIWIYSLTIGRVDKLTTDEVRSIALKYSPKMVDLNLFSCPGVGGTLRIDDCCQSLLYLLLDDLPLITIAASTQCRMLKDVRINSCHLLENFPSLLSFPNLKYLSILECNKLVRLGPVEEEIEVEASSVSGDQNQIPSLPKLQIIFLLDLPEMRSISNRCLRLPSLHLLSIRNCPKWKKVSIIPPDKDVQIECPRRWWESLELEDQTTWGRFNPLFLSD